jgi:CHAT domain-containing protein
LAEEQIRKRITEIKSERDKLQDVFNQQFPDYVALSKPQPLTIEQTQALLADDEALVAIDLDKKSYVWVITKEQAEWKELSVSAEDVSKSVETLRTGLNPNCPKPFDRNLAYQLYRQVLGPIEDIVSQKTRLSFVLDGALTSLPPQVLIELLARLIGGSWRSCGDQEQPQSLGGGCAALGRHRPHHRALACA